VSHPESHPEPEQTTVKVESSDSLAIQFSGKHQPHILRIHSAQKPATVSLDGAALSEGTAWQYDGEGQRIMVRTREYAEGRYVVSWR
jgi:hypothetical protein